MILEERKDNTYYDKRGKQILVGDLLKVFHFQIGRKKYYMYHVVVMEEGDFPVMAMKNHYGDKPHYRMFSVADNEFRAYMNAEIISTKDRESKRKNIIINLQVSK